MQRLIHEADVLLRRYVECLAAKGHDDNSLGHWIFLAELDKTREQISVLDYHFVSSIAGYIHGFSEESSKSIIVFLLHSYSSVKPYYMERSV